MGVWEFEAKEVKGRRNFRIMTMYKRFLVAMNMNESLKLILRKYIEEVEDGVKIFLNVKPKSRIEGLKYEFDELVFFTKEPPVKGKANTALMKFLSKVFDVSTSAVEIISGHKDRSKTVKIKGIPKDIAISKLLNYLSKT